MNLTRDQTLLKNKIHVILGKFNLNFQGSDLFGVKGRQWLANQQLPLECRLVVDNYLELLDKTKQQISKLDKMINIKGGSNPQVKLLKTIPGIGTTTAFLLVSEIGDINQFPSSKNSTSYLGLVPRLSQSGSHAYYGRITKVGNTYIMWALVQSAHRLIRYQANWRIRANKIAIRAGKKKAVVGIARKLATIVYAVLKKQEPYKPYQLKKDKDNITKII